MEYESIRDSHHMAREVESLSPSLRKVKHTLSDEATFSTVYKFLVTHAENAVWITDKDGVSQFVNEHFTNLTGYNLEDIKGKSMSSFFDEKYHPTIQNEKRRRKQGLISNYEVQFTTKSNESLLIKVTTYPLPNRGAISVIKDVTKQSYHENLHQFIVEKMDQGVWVSDSSDICIYANPSLCQMIGYTVDEMLTKTSVDIVSEQDKTLIMKELNKRAQGQISSYEISLRHKNGDSIPVRVFASPLTDGGNMAIFTDLRNEKIEEFAYKHLIENMNEAVWLRSSDGELEYANDHFCELVGYNKEELIGDTEYFYWDINCRDKIKKEELKRRQGISSVYRAVIKTKLGENVPVLVSATPTLQGGSFGIITDLRDVIAKENIYQNLVEHMNEAVWFGDKNERTLYVNPKFCEITGYTFEECTSKSSLEFLDEISREVVKQQNILRTQGKASKYEATITTKEGEKIPVLVSGTPTSDGGTIGILTDLREIKEKDQEIAKRDHYLASIIENSADGIISIDLDGMITSWNKGAEKIFGFKAHDVIGSHISVYMPKNKLESGELDHLGKEIAKRGFVKDFRTQRMHKEGYLVDTSLTKAALRDDEGHFIGYSSIYRDISLQKKWEEELNLRFENLKNAYLELGKKGRHMDYFMDLLDGIIGNFEINNISDFIIGAVAMITKVDACTLRRYNKERDSLVLQATNGVTAEWYNKGDEPFKDSLVEKAFKSRKALKILDLNQETMYKGQKLALKHGLTSMLVVPLYVKNECLGSLKLYISKESKFELLDNDFIEQFAKIVSIALKLSKENSEK